jgi:hypothetical protein
VLKLNEKNAEAIPELEKKLKPYSYFGEIGVL